MKTFDIMGKRKYFFLLSIVLLATGLVGYIINGLQLDIQFQGGTIIQIEMPDSNFETSQVETVVSGAINKKITAQKMQTFNPKDANDLIDFVQLRVSRESTLTDMEFNTVVDTLRREYGIRPDAEMDVKSVQPFIGQEMMQKGLKAALLASALIILYVWWRFGVMSGLAAAFIAVLALLHDTAMMFAVYAIFKIPVNESFVAAILTILGYSLNNTIVVYDRIRENSSLLRKSDIFDLVNKSINQTMSRSINTSITTLISVIAVLLFAVINNVRSLREFTLPLLVGFIAGTYSSMFIAGPLWAVWKKSSAVKKLPGKSPKAAKTN